MKKDLSRIKITTNLDFRGIQSRHFFRLVVENECKSETKKYNIDKFILKILIKLIFEISAKIYFEKRDEIS